MTIRDGTAICQVLGCNACAATVQPVEMTTREIHDRLHEKKVVITTKARTYRISTHSEVLILREKKKENNE
jgi:hypothetical protein